MIGPAQQGTPRLPAPTFVDDFLVDILGLFVESHIADLGDITDDLHLLFDEDESSSLVTRAHSDPPIHSLHDRSSHVYVTVHPYVQQL